MVGGASVPDKMIWCGKILRFLFPKRKKDCGKKKNVVSWPAQSWSVYSRPAREFKEIPPLGCACGGVLQSAAVDYYTDQQRSIITPTARSASSLNVSSLMCVCAVLLGFCYTAVPAIPSSSQAIMGRGGGGLQDEDVVTYYRACNCVHHIVVLEVVGGGRRTRSCASGR